MIYEKYLRCSFLRSKYQNESPTMIRPGQNSIFGKNLSEIKINLIGLQWLVDSLMFKFISIELLSMDLLLWPEKKKTE